MVDTKIIIYVLRINLIDITTNEYDQALHLLVIGCRRTLRVISGPFIPNEIVLAFKN
jgi:hypothetical protein